MGRFGSMGLCQASKDVKSLCMALVKSEYVEVLAG